MNIPYPPPATLPPYPGPVATATPLATATATSTPVTLPTSTFLLPVGPPSQVGLLEFTASSGGFDVALIFAAGVVLGLLLGALFWYLLKRKLKRS